MALFENFPYTNLQQMNLDWLIKMINDMKEGEVTSVNGQTGDVTLYENASVEFPNTASTVWNMVRTANGHRIGIAFHDDGNAYIIYDGYQYKLYNTRNEPVSPVTSVNGQTGAVVLYEGASMQLPSLTNEQLTSWSIFRNLNGTARGLQFNDDGTVKVRDGNTLDRIITEKHPMFEDDLDILFPEYEDETQHAYYIGRYFNEDYHGFKIYDDGRVSIMMDDETEKPLYIQGINDPSDFVNPENAVLEFAKILPNGSDEWGIIRNISSANVGLLFKYNSVTLEWELYKKVNNTLTKILTINDIPSGSGVVSINSKSGVVTLYGSDIELAEGFGETIKQAVDADKNELYKVEYGLFKVADGDVHPAIGKWDYVYVKNNATLTEGLYQASIPIVANAVIDASNVNSISGNVFSNRTRGYRDGQTITESFMCFGFVTSNGTNLSLFVPMLVSDTVTRITISSARISLRSPSGGYIGSFQLEAVNLIDSIVIMQQAGGIRIGITNNTAFTNAVNTTPFTGLIQVTMTFHNT